MKEHIYTIPINDAFDTDCECPYCGKTLHITGWIRECPIGIVDSEEIDVELFEDEE